MTGESTKVICSIDTSGSISPHELGQYVSEMLGLARSFANVEMRVLTHDVEVHDDIPIRNGDVNKIKRIKVHGGGGTSHRPLFDYIEQRKNQWDTKLLISFTDGYSDFPEKRPDVDTIFVLAGSHVPKENMPKWADVIVLE